MALTCVGCGGAGGAADEDIVPAEVPTIVAEIGTVTRRPIAEELTVRGTVAALPNEDVHVSAFVAGRVDAVTVAEGDTVERDQVIARLDTRPFEDDRRRATAALGQATVDQENARLNLERTSGLFERGIAAAKEVEDARAQMAAAQAELQRAEAEVSIADRQIARAVVRSPIAGQVVKRLVSVGEQVNGTADNPIAEVANLERVELAARVTSVQLSRIHVGQQARIVIPGGDPDGTLPGAVVAIAPSVDPTTNTILVRIRVDNADRTLKIGQFVEGRITIDTHPSALVVPPGALTRDNRGAAVYVVVEGVATRTAVTTGITTVEGVEVLSGLADGQSVLTSAVHGLGERAQLAGR